MNIGLRGAALLTIWTELFGCHVCLGDLGATELLRHTLLPSAVRRLRSPAILWC